MKRICAVFFILALMAGLGFSAVYYVDATGGLDTNDGLSTGAAWQTVAKVNGSAFNAGDSVLFKRGEVWREKLTVPSSGSAGNVITFGAYGAGDLPKFDGSEQIANVDFSVASGGEGNAERLWDGGFETWSGGVLTYWTRSYGGSSTVSRETSDVHGGSSCVKLTIDASNNGAAIYQPFLLTAGESYSLSVWYKTEAGKTAYLRIKDSAGNVYLQSDGTWLGAAAVITLSAATDWTNYTLNFDAHASYSSYQIMGSRLSAASSVILLDDFSIIGPTPAYANTYYASWEMGANLVAMAWEDDVRLTSKSFPEEVESSAGSFYYDSTNHLIYVHASDSSNVITNGKTYDVPLLTENIDDNGKDYLWLEYLEAVKTYSDNTMLGGIKLTGSHNTVSGCSSHNHRRHCLSFYTGADNGLATGCTLYDSTITAVVTFYGSTTTACRLYDSDVYNGLTTTIVMHGGPTACIVEHCNVYNTSGHANGGWAFNLYATAAAGHIIRYNNIYGYGGGALACTDHGGVKFYYNLITATNMTSAYGYIDLDTSTDTEIYNNVFYGGATYTLYQFNNSTDTTFKNNIVYAAASGEYVYVENGSHTDSVYDYNLYYGSTESTPFNWIGTDYNFADWLTNSSQDAHSLNVDPLFNSATDFRLRMNSPARGKGTGVSLTIDYAGNKIPAWTGKAPDIGAYEMRPTGIIVK